MQVNHMNFRSDWQAGRGFGRLLKNKGGGSDVDPAGKSEAQLLDGDELVCMGEKAGTLNTVDGFTDPWGENELRVRLDGKHCVVLPKPGELRDALLLGVPQPNSIETDPEDGSWFTTD